MPYIWGFGGQEVPDRVSNGSWGANGLQLTTFVLWSPPRNASNPVKTGGVLMPYIWGFGGQEVPDRVSNGSWGANGLQLTTFVLWSPPRNVSNPVKTGGFLMPLRWGLGGHFKHPWSLQMSGPP